MSTFWGTTRRNVTTAMPALNTWWGYLTSAAALFTSVLAVYKTVTSWGGWPVASLVLGFSAVVGAVALAWWGERNVRREAQAELARAEDEHAQRQVEMERRYGQMEEHAASLQEELRAEQESRQEWERQERGQIETELLLVAKDREAQAQRHTL